MPKQPKRRWASSPWEDLCSRCDKVIDDFRAAVKLRNGHWVCRGCASGGDDE